MFQLALITIGKWFCFSLCLGRKGNWKLLGSKIFLAKVIIIHNTTCSSGNCKTLQRNRKDLFFVTLPKGQNNIARSYTLSLCQSNKIMLQGANFFSLFQGNKEMFLWRPPLFFQGTKETILAKNLTPSPYTLCPNFIWKQAQNLFVASSLKQSLSKSKRELSSKNFWYFQ